MAGKWNPNDPFTIGLEWDARERATSEPIDYGRELGALVTPVTTVTVTGAAIHMPGPPAGGTDTTFATWNLVTVYQSGKERQTGQTREVSSVVNIAATSGGALGGGAANALDAVLSAVDGKYLTLDSTDTLTVNFTLPDWHTTLPRIIDVTFSMILSPVVTGSQVWLRWNATGPGFAVIEVDASGTYNTSTGEIFQGAYDWATTATEARRRPWLKGDIANLASGALDLVVLNAAGSTQVHWVGMTVTYCEENRTAVGGLHRSSYIAYPWEPGWQSGIQMVDALTETAGFQAVAGREYLVTVTRATDAAIDGQVRSAVAATNHYQTGEPRQVSALRPTDRDIVDAVAARRLSNGLLGGPVEEVDRAAAVVLISSAGTAVEAMSQPYADVVARSVSPVTQEVVASTFNALYSHVAVTARKFGSPAPLSVVVGGSTATLLPATFEGLETDALGYGRAVLAFNAPRAFVAGVEQTVSVTTGTGLDRWEVPALSTVVTGSPYPAATYGGTAQVGQSDAKLDYAISLLTAVPAVTGVAVGRGYLGLSTGTTACPPGPLFRSVDYTSVCWGQIPVVSGSPAITGTPLVTGFCAWEVERADAVDPLWRRIARVTDYNVLCISDYEARIGVSSHYRVRLVRTDGAAGDWGVVSGFVRYGPSTAASAPVVSGSGCDGLLFVSNENPDATVAYPYYFTETPIETFTFLEAATAVVQRLHMRDFQVVFRPLERGGVRFQRTVMVNALSMPASRLDEGFRSLRDLAWDSLTYVAVLDMRGNRWFATVLVPEGSVREMNHLYLASMDIIETTDQPSVIDVVAV